MQKGLRKNGEKKVTPAVEAKVRAAEDNPITFGDFEAALKNIVNGGRPLSLHGHSKHGQGMVNRGRSICIYIHVSIMANARDPPMDEEPKVPGNSQMKNMRPISLYEVIRKVWITTIAKRIHRVLHEAGVLHDR
jgi:hypothetical protein